MPLKAVFLTHALVCLFLLTAAAPMVQAKGLTCDFYDIRDVPEGWETVLAPGFNERRSSLGHYVNKEKNCSIMIQVSETRKYSTLKEVTEKTVQTLLGNGCTILDGPIPQGSLTRLEVTLTGTPATMWIGTDGDVQAVTVISGNREECRSFLTQFRASPQLLPSADQVFLP